MKKPLALFSVIFFGTLGLSQAPPLPPTVCKAFRPAGWIFFHDASINVGELFTDHKCCFFTEAEDSMYLDRTWSDDFLNYDHYHYTQKYLGVEVEGCEFIEHATSEGHLVYANGKICPDIYKKYQPKVIEPDVAFNNLISTYDNMVLWTWESPMYEAQYQADVGDPAATSKPSGELVFATNDWTVPVNYIMDANDYRLAWKFEVKAIAPNFFCTVYVDAITGVPFKMLDNQHHDGPANIPFYGSVNLDTRWEGWPTSAHVLHTNDGGRDVHTKFDGPWSWGLTGEVQDSDGNWGASQMGATAPHFGVTQAWIYFKDVHGRDGIEDNGGTVRVFAETGDNPGAWYEHFGTIDRIFAGYYSDDGVYTGEMSVVAHEFTHGVDQHSGKLQNINESGALDESFADIFGFLTRRNYNGSTDWTVGVPSTTMRNRRNFQNPNSFGFHYDFIYSGGVITGVTEVPGQPDTYGGTWWHPWELSGNDFGGIHINNAIQNKWFYILSMGESGINDLGDSYSVSGIGIDKAAEITYYNLTSNMEKTSQFVDAMEGAVATALLYYGECSFEHIQTQNAWYAVGVGDGTSCEGVSIEENALELKLYPNPVQDQLFVSFTDAKNRTLQIFGSNGQLLRTLKDQNNSTYSIDVSNFANGAYILNVIDGNNSEQRTFIKK